jgi:2-desacetyl-2-hydroxyethyl bacteriochlorophyllide A dehydrogenase
MNRQALCFTGPLGVEVRQEPVPEPGPGEVLVKTLVSGISSGTELLFYRGQVPEDQAVDTTIASLKGQNRYPLKYGYCNVGEVTVLGSGVERAWLGRKVFSFHPHESHFNASPDELLPLPQEIPAERAIFLPNMETALNLVMDGQPLVGEFVAVFGLGIVGLLTSAVLLEFPLAGLAVFDRYRMRRAAATQLGCEYVLDPLDADAWRVVETAWDIPEGLDLAFELSGAPIALDQAIAKMGYAGRIVIGSWYGTKPVSLNLGGKFHRSRIRLVSSQVSTIAPELSGRWNKLRRFGLAWKYLGRITPEKWITHRYPIGAAAEAYRLLAEDPAQAIQVVFTYDE